MTSISIIENKISAAKKYLKILDKYKNIPFSEILNNIDKKGALERYLYLVSQSAINLAEAFISYKNYRKPSSMSEAFHILNENDIINQSLTEKMVGMVGFRNIVTHDYEKIDYEIVEEVLKNGLDDISSFVNIISKKI